MTVIADWPHLPRQVEVQKEIDAVRDTYTTFVLCTPTSSWDDPLGREPERHPRLAMNDTERRRYDL